MYNDMLCIVWLPDFVVAHFHFSSHVFECLSCLPSCHIYVAAGDIQDVSIHMFSTTDSQLNPVIAWAITVQRVWGYPGATEDSKVCDFISQITGDMDPIKADHVRDHLRSIVDLIGEYILVFNRDDIGFHSIRSGGSMAMFLSHTALVIMM